MRFHKRSSVDGTGKCSIAVGGPGVHIAVYEVAAAERHVLDRIEGLGQGYDDHDVRLDGFGTCSTYIASPDVIDDSLHPTDWYKAYVLRGARFHGFPEAYVAKIESRAAVTDSNDARAAREWALVQSLSDAK